MATTGISFGFAPRGFKLLLSSTDFSLWGSVSEPRPRPPAKTNTPSQPRPIRHPSSNGTPQTEVCATCGLCPLLLKFFENGADASQRFRERLHLDGTGCDGGLFQFEDDGRFGRQRRKRSAPIDGSLVGKQMVVAFAAIVVQVRGRDKIAHDF